MRRKNPLYDPTDSSSPRYLFVRYYLSPDADGSKVLMRQTWFELEPGVKTDLSSFSVSRKVDVFITTYNLNEKTFDFQIIKKSISEKVEAKAFVNLYSMQ
jgi:hypothetical protein